MLTYNTQKSQLILPEYGRNIQAMVDHCLTIEDRDERTRCAHSIVLAMSTLFPEMRETEASRHKLWDHLAIMSGFKLDIDWPYEMPQSENLSKKPDRVAYPTSFIRYRHYGRSIEKMIDRAANMEPGEERDALINIIANQMKKMLVAINRDAADDARVFRDLAEYSHGRITLDPKEHHLHQFEIVAPPTASKKKKKK